MKNKLTLIALIVCLHLAGCATKYQAEFDRANANLKSAVANAEVATKAVAMPLERAINGVPGMVYMNSVSGNDGRSREAYFAYQKAILTGVSEVVSNL